MCVTEREWFILCLGFMFEEIHTDHCNISDYEGLFPPKFKS